MPRDERYPTLLLNMSPSGFAGFLVIVGMILGLAKLVPARYLLVGSALVASVALVAALAVRGWRAHHPSDESLLHLDNQDGNGQHPKA